MALTYEDDLNNILSVLGESPRTVHEVKLSLRDKGLMLGEDVNGVLLMLRELVRQGRAEAVRGVNGGFKTSQPMDSENNAPRQVTVEEFRAAVDAISEVAKCDEAWPVDAISMALVALDAIGIHISDDILDEFFKDA